MHVYPYDTYACNIATYVVASKNIINPVVTVLEG